jgi:activating signal cointegrator 1
MKAITIWQPYATLIMIGAKRFETRGWPTSYRGPLIIHAAKRWDEARNLDCARVCEVLHQSNFPMSELSDEQRRLFYQPISDTLGKALGVVQLVGSDPMEDGGNQLENEFGHFGPGRYGWDCSEPIAFEDPIHHVGKQGLWEPEKYLATAARSLCKFASTPV